MIQLDSRTSTQEPNSTTRAPERLRVLLYLLLLLLCAGLGCDFKSLALTWTGYADTDLQFDEFIQGDHTVIVRFMPEYPGAYFGPVLAENGRGRFAMGQGDYSYGDNGPKLYIRVGNELVTPAAELIAGQWHSLALVGTHTGLGVEYKVYFDGEDLNSDFVTSRASLNQIRGTLRFGRRSDGQLINSMESQFYGLIDDVAIFSENLGSEQIRQYAALDYTLTGNEPDLVAGYTFDDAALTPLLRRPVDVQGDAGTAITRSVKSNTEVPDDTPFKNQLDFANADAGAFRVPTHHPTMLLPIAPGDEWKVIQGFATDGSHKGYAAFCYDMVIHGGAQSAPYPRGSRRAPLHAVAPGVIKFSKDDRAFGHPNNFSGNAVLIEVGEQQFASYLHIWQNSSRVAAGDYVLRGEELALTGNVGSGANEHGDHLHWGMRNQNKDHMAEADILDPRDPNGSHVLTFPISFSNYELWDEETRRWVFVPRGVLRGGQVVRRRHYDDLDFQVTAVLERTEEQEIHAFGMDLHDFKQRVAERQLEGWYLDTLDATTTDTDEASFSATWTRAPEATERVEFHIKNQDLDWAIDDWYAAGYGIHRMTTYRADGHVRHTVVLRPSEHEEGVHYWWKADDVESLIEKRQDQGFRIHQIHPYLNDHGTLLYTIVFRRHGPDQHTLISGSLEEFRRLTNQLWDMDWPLKRLQVLEVDGEPRYTAVWEPGRQGQYWYADYRHSEFRSEYQNMWPDGWRLVELSVHRTPPVRAEDPLLVWPILSWGN